MASTNAPKPRKRSLSDIKSNLLRPSLTSHYDIFVREPAGSTQYPWTKFKQENGLSGFDQELLHLSCSEASLPGSALMTHELTSNYTGVSEKHAYRRQFDGKIDLTFYVMISPSNEDSVATPNRYLPIRFFEGWIKYISAEDGNRIADENYSYRMRFPKEYYGGLNVLKYERDYNQILSYQFVSAYPISVNSMPVSYEASNLLKCTVSFSYTRYYITDVTGSKTARDIIPSARTSDGTDVLIEPSFTPTPEQLALQNSILTSGSDLGYDVNIETSQTNFFGEEPQPAVQGPGGNDIPPSIGQGFA